MGPLLISSLLQSHLLGKCQGSESIQSHSRDKLPTAQLQDCISTL